MLARLLRLFRHRLYDQHRAISPAMLDRLRERVTLSEQGHRGEIRIYLEGGMPNSYIWREATARDRALAMFGKLGVWDTEENNGVLIYVLLAERAIEIVCDRGINRRVDPRAWVASVDHMRTQFRSGHFEAGLMQALDEVSALLVEHFPLASGSVSPNELPDAPLMG